jgi:alpha-L-fucosidase
MYLMKKNILGICLLLVLSATSLKAQKGYQPSKENLQAREWFENASFGMFIHWGVYSILGDGEWAMQLQKIDKKSYERLASFFNPVEYNPAEWVAAAKNAGMEYIVFTSRHHDGFAMFDSKQSDWDIVDRTIYKKDVLKMLTDECHKQGLKIFLYYSHADWYHDDYYPIGTTGEHSGRTHKGDWNKYLDYVDAQLTELLTNYGEISGIWFDGWWDKKDADWRFDKTYKLIHDLQPQCLIGNNHHQAPFPGEDFQMFERDLPGHNTAGYSPHGAEVISKLPLETCETINKTWGFNLLDKDIKSSKEIIHYLVKASGYNSNLLLNVGPMPNGKIQEEFVDTLAVVGKWLKKNGETIYGTRGGPLKPYEWGVTTQKGNKVYVHILNWSDQEFFLPKLGKKIAAIKLYSTKEKIDFIESKYGTVLKLPKQRQDQIDLILEVELSKK